MRYLWLVYFPILFLPNLGLSQATPMGNLQLSDFVIGPYIVLLLFAINWGGRLTVGQVTPLMGMFVAWALLSTITISLRYGYVDSALTEFSLFKLGKLVLYGLAGILTARALWRTDSRSMFEWSLLGAALVTGISLWLTKTGPVEEQIAAVSARQQASQSAGYSATNGISVMAAILLIYIVGRLLTGHGSRPWRFAAPAVLVVVIAGAAVSDGRGGWVAAIAGAMYFLLRLGPTSRLLLYGAVGAVVVLALYQSQPDFKRQVDITLFPVEEYGLISPDSVTRDVGTLDDGGRFRTWNNEIRKLDNAPTLGTGFYHRGSASGLWLTGSHNFWIQMLLETGVVGFGLIVSVVAKMWKQATELREDDRLADVALKGAIVTAIVGGMGGEYFYGGIILFTLLAIYASIGGLPVSALMSRAAFSDKHDAPAMPRGQFAGTPGD